MSVYFYGKYYLFLLTKIIYLGHVNTITGIDDYENDKELIWKKKHTLIEFGPNIFH